METITDLPWLYDLLYSNLRADIGLYRRLCRSYPAILEYGAGTGRITIPLAAAGHRVTALDNSSAMLRVLRLKLKGLHRLRRRVKVLQRSMIEFRSREKFDCAVIGLTTFNYLMSVEAQKRCLRNLAFSLRPGGRAIVELLSARTFTETNRGKQPVFIKKLIFPDGRYYEYWRTTTMKAGSRVLKQSRKFRLFDKNHTPLSEITLRWVNRFVTVPTFKKLVAESGMKVEKVYGDCKLSTYRPGSPDVFVQIRKPLLRPG